MDISSLFPGKFIKAADLAGNPKVITIASITNETVGDDLKPVLRWGGSEQGLVLNKTNAMMIAGDLGQETSDWIGKQIEIYPTQTQFGTKIVPAIRVRVPGTADLDSDSGGNPF